MANSGTSGGFVRVAVVDDDEDTRLCLQDILHSRKNLAFAGGFSTAKEALTTLPNLRPDIALVDIALPDMDGIQCAQQLRQSNPSLKVIIVSGNRDTNSFERSSSAGAAAYLVKPVDPDQLIATIHHAAIQSSESQNIGFSPKGAATRRASLSPREIQVLSGLADGLLYKEISDKLSISFSAVHKYTHSIYKKLGVSTRFDAIRTWFGRGR